MTQSGDTHFFESNGIPIHYHMQGNGRAVVLVHGITRNISSSWAQYGFFTGPLDDYKLIAMDCRGHGQSGKPHDPAAYGQQMVDDVIRLLDHLQIEQAYLLGHSMGAEIVLKAVVQNPTRLHAAILAGSGWSDDSVYALFKPLAESLARGEGFRPFLEWGTPPGEPPPSPAQIEELNKRMLPGNDVQALEAICRNYDELQELRVTEEELRNIKVPILGVVGEHDIERPMLERMEGVVPNFTLRVLTGLGHTGPEFFKALLSETVEFLGSSSLQSAGN